MEPSAVHVRWEVLCRWRPLRPQQRGAIKSRAMGVGIRLVLLWSQFYASHGRNFPALCHDTLGWLYAIKRAQKNSMPFGFFPFDYIPYSSSIDTEYIMKKKKSLRRGARRSEGRAPSRAPLQLLQASRETKGTSEVAVKASRGQSEGRAHRAPLLASSGLVGDQRYLFLVHSPL